MSVNNKWTADQLAARGAFIRANLDQAPADKHAGLLKSAAVYERLAMRKRRLQAVGLAAIPAGAGALFVVPSMLTPWADVSLEMSFGGMLGAAAVTAITYEARRVFTWLEARRPQHESARLAELQLGDRPARPRRRPSPQYVTAEERRQEDFEAVADHTSREQFEKLISDFEERTAETLRPAPYVNRMARWGLGYEPGGDWR